MNRRIAVAAALAVLTVLVGGRWMATRHTLQAAAASGVPAGVTPAAVGSGLLGPAGAASAQATPSPPVAVLVPPAVRAKVGPYGSRRMSGATTVALTFDDGPHPVWTPQVLDLLRAARVKATFCLVGSQVRKHPALVVRIVREGHTLCNHTYGHELGLGNRPVEEIRRNLSATTREIRQAVPGAKIPYFRHPGGYWTQSAVDVARELGMVPIDWDVDPRDWETTDAAAISTRVTSAVRPGSIVLLHDGGGDRRGTLAACPGMIRTLKKRYGIGPLR